MDKDIIFLILYLTIIAYLLLQLHNCDSSVSREALTPLDGVSENDYENKKNKYMEEEANKFVTNTGYTAGQVELNKPAISKPSNDTDETVEEFQNPVEHLEQVMGDAADDNDFNSKDFLPADEKNDWWDLMHEDKGPNYIGENSTNLIGTDTKGQSLKNACLDIRGDIYVPKIRNMPWNMSSIEPDNNIYQGLC